VQCLFGGAAVSDTAGAVARFTGTDHYLISFQFFPSRTGATPPQLSSLSTPSLTRDPRTLPKTTTPADSPAMVLHQTPYVTPHILHKHYAQSADYEANLNSKHIAHPSRSAPYSSST
jgi:hypothetical protein